MERRWKTKAVAVAAAVGVVGAAAGVFASVAGATGQRTNASTYEPQLDPANFVSVIDNKFYPLPVGRVLTYRGIKDGVTQRETVTVTDQTRVIEGITATMITDVSVHQGTLLEKTSDWYAQDKQGNVWYLGEDTKAYRPNGTYDTSGSWIAGENDGEPGIIMKASPQVPDGYRQEYLAGQAADMGWVVRRGGSVTVPYGTIDQIMTSLEASTVEPGAYDQKIYGPGLGIVYEQSLTDVEWAKLVSVTG
ncbi:MAG: hypothetical protein QOI60_1131 [Actinomycetota bacterium]|nr:hypothetical protein [Actinomycetota bacterium]